jgi:hypothetical protein
MLQVLQVLQYLQLHHTPSLAYILENVPSMGHSWANMMVNVQQIRS